MFIPVLFDSGRSEIAAASLLNPIHAHNVFK